MQPLTTALNIPSPKSLELREWCVWYGQAQALFDVNLSLQEGECVALLGRNGAGKSTLIQSIMGLVPKREGQLFLESQDLMAREPFELARMGLGWVPEDRRIFSQLTVMENLRVGFRSKAHHFSDPKPRESFEQQFSDQLERVLTLFPPLGALLKRLGGHLSGGEQQMLSMARTLMSEPRWILMDEVCEGVAPQVLENLKQSVRNMLQTGICILMAEQNIGFVNDLCNKAYVLERGRIVAQGGLSELSDPLWIQAQLKHLS